MGFRLNSVETKAMEQTLPQFFSWKGELGRLRYFRQGLLRALLMIPLLVVYAGLSLLAGNDLSFALFESPFVTVLGLVLFIPIDLRRMNDAGIKYWWLVVFQGLWLLPVSPASEVMTAYDKFHALIVVLPMIVWSLILLFKPGREYREFVRAQAG